MAEKGNVTAAAAEAASTTGGSGGFASAVGGTAAVTVTKASETMRDKIIGRAVDHGLNETRDRMRERRERKADEVDDGEAGPVQP